MGYKVSLGLHTYQFSDLKTVMAKASPLRSGDCLSGVAALSNEERVAAALVLADLPLKRFLEEQLIAYEDDEVTRVILDDHQAEAFTPMTASPAPYSRPSMIAAPTPRASSVGWLG